MRTRRGEITPQGIWWAGWYIEFVNKTLLQNNIRLGPAEEFEMLGRGACTDEAEESSMTGTITIAGEAKYKETIKGSFGFSGSGTRTFRKVYKYCGPSEGAEFRYRYFYRQLIYNKYEAHFSRC